MLFGTLIINIEKFSLEGQKIFVNTCLNNKNIDLHGIFHENTHIGNIQITRIKNFHKNAEISYVIENTDYWGKGAASFTISKIIEISKTNYELYKLFAGVADENIASIKVLKKINL
jgi:RimJ/RimL family protein N-acetyltransferase